MNYQTSTEEEHAKFADFRNLKTFKKVIGKSGVIWLIGNLPNAANHIYVSDDCHGGSFGQRLSFQLEDGTEEVLIGPWHSNSESLFNDTGIDIRNKHVTLVVVSQSRGLNTCDDVVYIDDAPVVGEFDRGKEIAQRIANQLGGQVYLYSRGLSGSSSTPIKPE